jgi:LytR cell envelope-related transcriptional attenuator
MPAAEPPEVLPRHATSARDRRQRQNNTFLVAMSVVLVIGFIALGNWMQWWTIGGKPADAAQVLCPVQKVTDPNLTRVNVYNGTNRRGLAAAVARELQRRKFHVLGIATRNQGKPIKAVALIKYGEPGRSAARTVALQFPAKVVLVRDARDSRTVDVVIGQKYGAMVKRTKAAAAIKPIPEPEGCVEPTATTDPATGP